MNAWLSIAASHMDWWALLIPWMSFLARQAGGGAVATWLVYHVGTKFGAFWGSFASRVPEIIWAITIAVMLYLRLPEIVHVWSAFDIFGLHIPAVDLPSWVIASFAAVWSYIAIELGHGTFFAMKGYDSPDNPARKQTTEYVIQPIYELLGGDKHDPLYSWINMGFKGLLIAAPTLPYGAPLVIGWPVAYWIAFRLLKKDSAPAEMISGAFMGGVLWLM